MKTEEFNIIGCRECPFFYINPDGDYFCSNQKKKKELTLSKLGDVLQYPKWCPLLKKSFRINLIK